VRVAVEPKPNDSTTRIQQAIDYIATLPPDTNGLRGAVLLRKGRHEIRGGLHITNSGVVLRGQGMGEDGTVVVVAGLDRRTLIRVVGKNDSASRSDSEWQITDEYVPLGTASFHLKNADDFKPGDTIRLVRPSIQEW